MSLQDVAKRLVSDGKGIFAADASPQTLEKRFEAVGLTVNTPEDRLRYRLMTIRTKGLGEYVSGVILHDEAFLNDEIRQALVDQGILLGIKVDGGLKDGATVGIETLQTRLPVYKKMGATFCKWRTVIEAGSEINKSDIENLALYAAKCQENDLVPVVEPEVLWEEGIDVELYAKTTSDVTAKVFEKLFDHKVNMEGIVYKPNMVVARDAKTTALKTLEVMQKGVSVAVPGIAFLSGGQDAVRATENLNEINKLGSGPWRLTFSFERAIEGPAMEVWGGRDENALLAQEKILHRARMNSLASMGRYIGE